MDIRGPCLLTFHNGSPCRLYEVVTSKKNMQGFSNVRYFFTSWEDAEIYVYYLYQVDGVDFIKRVQASKKMPNWEKREYKAFLDSLDLNTLKQLVSTIQFTSEKNFTPHLTKRDDYGEDDDTDYDSEELGC